MLNILYLSQLLLLWGALFGLAVWWEKLKSIIEYVGSVASLIDLKLNPYWLNEKENKCRNILPH